MMIQDKPKDADILERVKDILNKKDSKNNISSLLHIIVEASFTLCITNSLIVCSVVTYI